MSSSKFYSSSKHELKILNVVDGKASPATVSRTRIQSGKAKVQKVGDHLAEDQKQNRTSSW